MSNIIIPYNEWHLELIPCKHLARLKNELIYFRVVLIEVFIDLLYVQLRCPRVCIHDSQNDVVLVDIVLFEVILLKMFNAPAYICCFASLLKFAESMDGISHEFQLIFVLLNQL